MLLFCFILVDLYQMSFFFLHTLQGHPLHWQDRYTHNEPCNHGESSWFLWAITRKSLALCLPQFLLQDWSEVSSGWCNSGICIFKWIQISSIQVDQDRWDPFWFHTQKSVCDHRNRRTSSCWSTHTLITVLRQVPHNQRGFGGSTKSLLFHWTLQWSRQSLMVYFWWSSEDFNFGRSIEQWRIKTHRCSYKATRYGASSLFSSLVWVCVYCMKCSKQGCRTCLQTRFTFKNLVNSTQRPKLKNGLLVSNSLANL